MPLTLLIWFFTLGVALHNLEEALYLPAWTAHAGRWHARVSPPQFWFAVSLLTLALLICAAAASLAGAASLPAYLFSGYVFAMLANVLFPHLLASLLMRRYMPGTLTALLFNLPLGGWFLFRAVIDGFVRAELLVWSAPLIALGILAALPVLFALGRKLFPG